MSDIKTLIGGPAATLVRAADKMARAILDRQSFPIRPLGANSPLARTAQRFLEASDIRDQLIAAEAMADEVEKCMNRAPDSYHYLDSRSPPSDALLDYRNPSGHQCDSCSRPEAKFYFQNHRLCTHCFIPHIPN